MSTATVPVSSHDRKQGTTLSSGRTTGHSGSWSLPAVNFGRIMDNCLGCLSAASTCLRKALNDGLAPV
eukprot:5584242-Pleurochrysis_carterae.AAC.1